MKYTLTYKNKQGVEARLDIITFGSTSTIETIEGTDTPFILNYKREKNDKEGYIISSSADIAIYESGTFNIDTLKTSNETDIKVEYYIDNVLTWSGFVVPDFFSRVIGTPAVVNMVASDRLGSLKGQTLSGLPAMVTLSSLVSSCLSKTGLSLPINLKADFTSVIGNENVFASKVISQRFTDTKGRNISCYDILRSILVMTNSVVVQRNGQWYVANKIQIEQGTALPTTQYVDFDEVSVGARRQIMPVASSVGVYHEFGGGRKHPQNSDFSNGTADWLPKDGFHVAVEDREILSYTRINNIWNVDYGEVTDKKRLEILNVLPGTTFGLDLVAYTHNTFPIISLNKDAVKIDINIGVTGKPLSTAHFVIIADNGSKKYAFNQSSSAFEPYDQNNQNFLINIKIPENTYDSVNERYIAAKSAAAYSATFQVQNVEDYNISIRVYGTDSYNARVIPIFIDFVSLTFLNVDETPKGNIYKTTQGDNFTKVHETDTTVIGDYRTSGLNGYGYPYPIDDTSSLLTSTGLLTERWTAPDNANKLPILQHVTRQRAKMFSIAHDLLTAEIDSDVLDPLATFRDCSGKKYVMVSGSQDFLRGTINVEIEEIAYSTTIWKQDYIYSYFGEGEEGISSVGGISESAPSAGGGGITPEQLEILNNLSSWWKYDDVNDAIYSELSVYSKKEVSAYGLGESGGGTGVTALSELVDVDLASLEVGNMLVYNGTHWVNLPQSAIVPDLSDYAKKTYVDTAIASLVESAPSTLDTLSELAAALGDDPNFATTVTNMIAGKEDAIVAGNASQYFRGDKTWQTLNTSVVPESGNLYFTNARVKAYADTLYLPLNGNAATATKLQTARSFSITGAATASAVNFDGTANVALNVTSLSAGNLTGTMPSSVLGNSTLYVGTTAIPLNRQSAWQDLTGITSMQIGSASASAKLMYDAAKNAVYVVGSDGTTAVNFYATGELSAYGAGSGSGGGSSYNRLDAWADYDSTKSGWVLSALLGNELNTRVGNLEGGSALTVNTTGTGNAITSISKSGTVITASKDLTFSLSNHLHTGVYEPVFSKNTAFNKNFGTTAGTVAEGNDSRIINGQTAYGWGNHASAGYALNSSLSNYLPLTGGTLTGNLTAPTFVGALNGNASSATKLQTARTIAGVSFDGSANIDIPFANLINKPTTLAGYGISVSDVLTQLKTVDGAGSGLDADLLDGLDGTRYSFVLNGYNSDALSTYSRTGVYATSDSNPDKPPVPGGTVYNHIYSGRYGSQIFGGLSSNRWYARTSLKYTTGWGSWREFAFIDSNVASATKLQTARTIAGVSFDGTADIAIPFANLSSKPTTLSGYGITDFTSHNNGNPINPANTTVNAIGYILHGNVSLFGQDDGGVINIAYSYDWQSQIFQDFRTGQIALRGKNAGAWTSWRTVWDNSNLTNLNQLTTRNFSDLQNKPTTLSGYGITDAVTTNTTQTISGAKTFSALLTASAGVNTPKVDFGNGFTVEPSGTELVFKYNGVIKQRMLSDGSIVATGELTAYS